MQIYIEFCESFATKLIMKNSAAASIKLNANNLLYMIDSYQSIYQSWWVAGRFTCFIHLSCKKYPYFVESIRYNVFKIYLRDNVIFMYSSYEISVLVFLTICIEQNLYVFNYSKVHYLCRSRIVLFILWHHCVHIALFSHVSAWLQLRSGKVGWGRGVWHLDDVESVSGDRSYTVHQLPTGNAVDVHFNDVRMIMHSRSESTPGSVAIEVLMQKYHKKWHNNLGKQLLLRDVQSHSFITPRSWRQRLKPVCIRKITTFHRKVRKITKQFVCEIIYRCVRTLQHFVSALFTCTWHHTIS